MSDGPPRFGPPPRLEDIEAYFRWALGTHSELSKRMVARELDLARETVRRIMEGEDSRYSNVIQVLRYVQEYVDGNRVDPEAPVSEIMTPGIITAKRGDSAADVAEVMATRAIQMVPLSETEEPKTHRELEGLLRRADLEKWLQECQSKSDPTIGDSLADLSPLEARKVDHRTPCKQAAGALESEPKLLVITRLGRLEGVVTPANLSRIE